MKIFKSSLRTSRKIFRKSVSYSKKAVRISRKANQSSNNESAGCFKVSVWGVIILVTFTAIGDILANLTESNLLWIVPVILVLSVLFWWFLNKTKEEKRQEIILAMTEYWGESFCIWLIENGYNSQDDRVFQLANHIFDWGEITVKNLLQRKICAGITIEMASLALGEPNIIDSKSFTSSGHNSRWVYGTPRSGALYIWFRDEIATKIKVDNQIIGAKQIKGTVKVTSNSYLAGSTSPLFVQRERIPDDVQMFVWQRDQGCCVKCGSQENLEYDHIIPFSKGGSNSSRNLQLLCANCNRSKGAKIGG